jgi:hypothetical protein
MLGLIEEINQKYSLVYQNEEVQKISFLWYELIIFEKI